MTLDLIETVFKSKTVVFSANQFSIVNKGETVASIGGIPLDPDEGINVGFSEEKIEFNKSITFVGGTGNLLIIGVR